MMPHHHREEAVMREIPLLSGMRTYMGKLRTLRNESRTRRLLGSLPSSIRKDIGWPDCYDQQRLRRRS